MITEILTFLLDPVKLFDIKLINPEDFLELLLRFSFNLIIVFCIVHYIYYPIAKRKDYYFAYILVSVIVFLLCFSLIKQQNLLIGIALGLFAIFGILRFRTRQIPVKEMTYLFLVVGISVINSLVTKFTSYAELLFINLAFVVIVWAGERFWLSITESRKTIVYEKIDMVKPENRDLLIEDLKKRTGLNIKRIEIGRINFLRDTVRIRIYYSEDINKAISNKGKKGKNVY